MCELFAMSSLRPTRLTISLDELARRGGDTGPHKDGWGIAYYDELDVRLLREAEPAAHSPFVQFIRDSHLEGELVLAHIRKATQGAVGLRNTQPFARQLGGRMHVFAHNGHLRGIEDRDRFPFAFHRPVGGTDSEQAFCALLARLQPLWLGCSEPPSLDARLSTLRDFARELDPLGPANFLYSDGELLVAHGNRRNQPDGSMAPPGLWRLQRSCNLVVEPEIGDAVHIDSTCQDQEVLLVASVPLSDENWIPLEAGELIWARQGRLGEP